MKTSTRIIATTLATLSFGAAGLVFAQQGVAPGAGPGMGHGGMGYGMGYGMGGHMFGADASGVSSARLSDLKANLKITAQQEPAWQAYEAVVRQQAEAAQAFHASMSAQMQDPAAAAKFDWAAQREAMLKWRESSLAERLAARQALFAVLTPEQQALMTPQRFPGQGRHMGWGARAQ